MPKETMDYKSPDWLKPARIRPEEAGTATIELHRPWLHNRKINETLVTAYVLCTVKTIGLASYFLGKSAVGVSFIGLQSAFAVSHLDTGITSGITGLVILAVVCGIGGYVFMMKRKKAKVLIKKKWLLEKVRGGLESRRIMAHSARLQ